MPLVRRTILVLSLATVAAPFCSHLYAQGKTETSGTPVPCGAACPSSLDVGCKQACTTNPIWCPDDYSPKCPPCICPPTDCGTCDCYQAKCPPCICPPTYCGTCNCYQAKCPPCLKIPCWFPSFYQCPPPKWCGSQAAKPGITKQPCR